MRILFHCMAASGHFHPMVPLAKSLQANGHEVAFACAHSFLSEIKFNGFEAFSVGIDFMQLLETRKTTNEQHERMPGHYEFNVEMMADIFVSGFARRALPDLLELAINWKPSVMVRESADFATPLIAEKLGIRHVTVQVGGGDLAMAENLVHERLMPLRSQLGLSADTELEAITGAAHLVFAPPSFFRAGVLPVSAQYFYAGGFDQSGFENLPTWAEKLGARPIVYATLGTAFNKTLNPLVAIGEGLKDEPFDVVITVGRDQDPASFGISAENIYVERYIPQTLIFPNCSLLILHGGYSSIISGIQYGVPMLLVPMGADHSFNSERAQALGVAHIIRPDQITPEVVRDRVRHMFTESNYREFVRKLCEEFKALPGLDRAVTLVEALGR